MERADNAIALAIFKALGATRQALGTIAPGVEFQIILKTDNDADDIDATNVASVEARLEGKNINTESSIYKIAGIVIVNNESDVEFKKTTVKVSGKTLISTRELNKLAQFNNLPAHIENLEKENAKISITDFTYHVLGKIGVVNRYSSDPEAVRRLKYSPEAYDGYRAFSAVMNTITDLSDPEQLKKYTAANATLLASPLRAGVENEPDMLAATIVCRINPIAAPKPPKGATKKDDTKKDAKDSK